MKICTCQIENQQRVGEREEKTCPHTTLKINQNPNELDEREKKALTNQSQKQKAFQHYRQTHIRTVCSGKKVKLRRERLIEINFEQKFIKSE